MRRTRTRTAVAALVAAAAMVLAACGSSANDVGAASSSAPSPSVGTSGESAAPSSQDSSAENSSAATGSAESSAATDNSTAPASEAGESATGAIDFSKDTKKDLTIPIASGWDEDVAVSNLFKYLLEKQGYTVDLPTLDIAPIFKGVATGDYDFFFDTWLPNTHKDYWAQFGDQVTDLGVWYDKAPLTIAVPDYMKIDSLDQLKSIGDQVDKTITGIDPGAGLSRVTKDDMMPAYGLDDWTLKLSSTAAMLAELKTAIKDKKPIVVTLWRPHWAYSAFPIKDLKDPKGAMGEPDSIHVIGSDGFVSADPGLAALLKHFHMDADTLGDLENVVLQEHKDDPQAGVAAWVKDNPDFVTKLLG